MQYDFTTIEARWQAYWAEQDTFAAPNPGDKDFDSNKPKFYVLDMFPYPSGVGLHVGHPLGYIATDIVSRYKRMRGFNVLHPMGYDAFGLPAEQFAVEHGVHPRVTTEKNIANMTRQLKRLGLSYDWNRELSTTDVGYYKWTQWIFLQLYHSWFDPAAGELGAARPISELINRLESGEMYVGIDGELISAMAKGGLDALGGAPIGASKWFELSEEEQRQVLDNHRLAYIAEVPVNWCPALGTVLANEEVTNEGRSERGNHPVFKRPLKQWMLRITAYAERLIADLEPVAWPEPIKKMQRDWIGRSEGAHVDFTVADSDEVIRVFTTRPDTLFGATYMVLAPEHELVDIITTDGQRTAIEDYRRKAAAKTDIDRQAETKQKTGVFTGAYAINPVNNEKIPVWIADYVLMGYGTGAIMSVPAHDERDFAFAKQFDLPIVQVVQPNDGQADPDAPFTDHGVNINSTNADVSLNGLPTVEAKRTITHWLSEQGLGQGKVQYKLRDWLFSRQRYWGEPFPILHGDDGEIRAVDVKDLPVELPPMEDFRPTASDDPDAPPQPPLSRAPDAWKHVTIDGKRYTRELNTMPQWAGSCWYYLRFLDAKNDDAFVSPEAEKYWMVSRKKGGQVAEWPSGRDKDTHRATGPLGHSTTSSPYHAGGVDLYVGGAEHAVLHLLYARFWHKVLFDLGHVSTPEPFGRLFNQGYIQAYAYRDERGIAVDADAVVDQDGTPAKQVEDRDDRTFTYEGNPVTRELGKMGKSLKNAVTPDEICEQYGCDTMRLYEMYLGPLDQSKMWRTRDILGVHRFLQRLWRNFVNDETGALKVTDDAPTVEQRKLLHKTIKKVTDDMERMSFNTAIAALIELNNALVSVETLPREVAEKMTLLLAPIAPHVAEEFWRLLGHDQSLTYEPWPQYDPTLLVESEIEYPVQINGKLKTRIKVPADADQGQIETAVKTDDKVLTAVADKSIRKVIVIKGKMINVVVV